MRLPPTPCRVCFRPYFFNKFSHFWQKNSLSWTGAKTLGHRHTGHRGVYNFSGTAAQRQHIRRSVIPRDPPYQESVTAYAPRVARGVKNHTAVYSDR